LRDPPTHASSRGGGSPALRKSPIETSENWISFSSTEKRSQNIACCGILIDLIVITLIAKTNPCADPHPKLSCPCRFFFVGMPVALRRRCKHGLGDRNNGGKRDRIPTFEFAVDSGGRGPPKKPKSKLSFQNLKLWCLGNELMINNGKNASHRFK